MSRDFVTKLSIGAVMLLPFISSNLYAEKGKECSNETIKGVYGYTVTGFRAAAGAPGQLEQLFGVGTRNYDGQGNFTQVQTEKGTLTPAPVIDAQGAGTYTVNSDCTGTLTTATGIQTRFVVMAKGKEIRWIVVAPAVLTITGHAIRQ